MTFQWRHLLQIAVNLLSGSPEEREHRSAINRAYYSAYGEAREFSIRHGYQMNSRQSSHEQIWQHLRSGGPNLPSGHRAALKAIGDSGIKLRTLRVQADYKLNSPPTSGDANTAIGLATSIIRRLNGIP